MYRFFLFLLLVVGNHWGYSQMPKPISGQIKRLANFSSKYVDARNIDIWLPKNYQEKKKYAVLYMQDGQSLYDSSITWNHQSWEVDDVLSKLLIENKIQDVIVVGIWNGQKMRHAEYFPQKPYESLSQIERDSITATLQRASRTKEVFQPISDQYLQFLVKELKPFIDKNYSTFPDKNHTFIAGSSMGGLISLYAICEYPTVFGGAACLSTHWPGTFSVENNPIPNAFLSYLNTHLPEPQTHQIYFDYGDQTLDELYPPLQKKVDEVMKKKHFSSKHWQTQFFPGDNHSELSWSKRLHIPMLFLLGKTSR
ncbi:alpha/beta hydrolase [Aquirufa sp. ROCK2-A2]